MCMYTSVDGEFRWWREVGHGALVHSGQTNVHSLAGELAEVQHPTGISLIEMKEYS